MQPFYLYEIILYEVNKKEQHDSSQPYLGHMTCREVMFIIILMIYVGLSCVISAPCDYWCPITVGQKKRFVKSFSQRVYSCWEKSYSWFVDEDVTTKGWDVIIISALSLRLIYKCLLCGIITTASHIFFCEMVKSIPSCLESCSWK